MALDTLHELLEMELYDLYSAEKLIEQTLPRLANAAASPELRDAFEDDLRITEQQLNRLDEILEMLDLRPDERASLGVEGMVRELEQITDQDAEPAVKDAALIASVQKIKHYQIAAYGSAKTYARDLGLKNIEKLLNRTEDEALDTDRKLSHIAQGGVFSSGINQEAPQ
jgi:ferritin-like metal-binding protein YciE